MGQCCLCSLEQGQGTAESDAEVTDWLLHRDEEIERNLTAIFRRIEEVCDRHGLVPEIILPPGKLLLNRKREECT